MMIREMKLGGEPHTALRSCTCDIVFLDDGTEISQMVAGRCCRACSLDGEGEKADFSSFHQFPQFARKSTDIKVLVMANIPEMACSKIIGGRGCN